MIDNAWIEGTQKIANARLKKDYPLMDENHFAEWEVECIIESFLMLVKEWNDNNTED